MFSPKMRLLAALKTTLLAATLSLSTLPLVAQETQVSIASNAYGATRSVKVEMNKSITVDLPAGVAEVIVSQPAIAAAIMRTRNRAIVQGISEGATNIIFIDDAGRTMSILDVNIVVPPLEVGRALEATLQRVIPGSNIQVETLANNSVNDKIFFVLTGTVQTAEDKANAEAMAWAISDSDSEEKGGSLIQVIGAQQVMLQVTVSEVQRNVAKQLGVNLSGSLSVGTVQLGLNNSTTTASNTDGISGNFPIGNASIDAAIRALERRNGLRILAQPTLTAMSGQAAEFKAGGEFPIPVVDRDGRTVVTYKEYGINLAFTPVVKSNGQVGLTIDTSVSEVQTGSFALTSRSAKTNVELPAGTTIAIGGLLQERSTQQIEQLPGLGNIPILGALFRSRDYLSEQTELVILVTPYLVAPSPLNAIPVPTDRSTVATDAESIFLGKLESNYAVGPSGAMRGSISGSVGFVLD